MGNNKVKGEGEPGIGPWCGLQIRSSEAQQDTSLFSGALISSHPSVNHFSPFHQFANFLTNLQLSVMPHPNPPFTDYGHGGYGHAIRAGITYCKTSS